MDPKQCMIVDIEQRDNKRMFITEHVSSISLTHNGLWAVRFSSSTRIFNYNYCCPVNFKTALKTFPKPFRVGLRGFFFKKQAP